MTEHREDALLEAVTKKLLATGLPLELRTARAAMRSGFATVESFRYIDPFERKPREGDVVVHGSISAEGSEIPVQLVMECKDSPGYPWVGVRNSVRRARRTHDPRHWATAWNGKVKPALDELITHGFDTDLREPCNRILSPMSNGDKNPARDACLQIMSATQGLINNAYRPHVDDEGRDNTEPVLGIGLIVTTAPLFTCQLGKNGTLDVQPVDTFSILSEKPAQRSTGPEAVDSRPSTVRITTEDHLTHYLHTLATATGRRSPD